MPGCMRTTIVTVVALDGGATLAAASTQLRVVDRPTHHKARLTYASDDAAAGLDKGSGTDRTAIAVDVYLRQGGVTTRFTIPAGAFDGRAGWIVNDAALAL